MRGREATPSQKEAAFIRQEGKCILCGEFLLVKQTHHVKYASRMGLSLSSNLVCLCPNCHQKIHIEERAIEQDKRIRKQQRTMKKKTMS